MNIIETKGTIIDIVQLSKKVKHFLIDLDDNISFDAGQFVTLTIEENSEKLTRSYSIASAPIIKGKIELCIKLVPSGKTTPHIFNKKIGDQLVIKGPYGNFTLKKTTKNKIVFIGIGTAVAPFRSMIKYLIRIDDEKEILFIHGSGYEENLLYKSEFVELERLHPNFKYVNVLSRPNENWSGRTGSIEQNLDIIDILNSEVFICGKKDMIEKTKQYLFNKGFSQEFIYEEGY